MHAASADGSAPQICRPTTRSLERLRAGRLSVFVELLRNPRPACHRALPQGTLLQRCAIWKMPGDVFNGYPPASM